MKEKIYGDPLVPHSNEWYDRLSGIQSGYYYNWKSELGNQNGEDVFLQMLFELTQPNDVVLDVGCGHGELTLNVAEKCNHIIGYDRTAKFIALARKMAIDQNCNNCEFIVGDSRSPDPNDKTRSHIPVEKTIFDVIYSRRGPLNYIHDVRRVSRIGTRIIQLNPAHINPEPFVNELPTEFQEYFQIGNEFGIKDSVQKRLKSVGLDYESYWFFDVPEYFDEAEQLYKFLSWHFLDNPPYPFVDVRVQLEKIMRKYQKSGRFSVRQRRFLWTCKITE